MQEFTVTEKKLHHTVKNLPAPGINRVQSFWWKIFMGMWSAILRCFNQWLELSDKKTDWLTRGQTELLPKTVGMRETIVQLLVSIPATRYLLA